VYVEQVYVEQVYVEQVYVEQVYVEQVYVEQVYVEQVYVEQVFDRYVPQFENAIGGFVFRPPPTPPHPPRGNQKGAATEDSSPKNWGEPFKTSPRPLSNYPPPL
jgi:hypothetical protein